MSFAIFENLRNALEAAFMLTLLGIAAFLGFWVCLFLLCIPIFDKKKRSCIHWEYTEQAILVVNVIFAILSSYFIGCLLIPGPPYFLGGDGIAAIPELAREHNIRFGKILLATICVFPFHGALIFAVKKIKKHIS
jgi:hypothetical protein